MQLNGSQIFVEVLCEQGVDTIFGYPGGAVLNLYDELYKNAHRITHVLTAHEQGAAHAADGYARATGRTGVVLATSGPGATNLVTGIATAYMDSVPMVAFTGNVATPGIGKDSFQEAYIEGITMPITKHNFTVRRVEDLADTMRAAFRIAQSGRKGPVLVDIPKDVTAAVCEFENKQPEPIRTVTTFDAEQVRWAADLINAAQRPLVYFGGGVRSAASCQPLRDLLHKAEIPATYTLMAAGVVPYGDPMNIGMLGMHGCYTSNRAVADCDVLIAVGTRFSDRVALKPKTFAKNATIIQIDIDPSELGKNVEVDLSIVGDAAYVLQAMLPQIKEAKHPDWMKMIHEWQAQDYHPVSDPTRLMPHQVIGEVCNQCGPEAVYVTDVGQHQMWAAQYLRHAKSRGFITSGGLGTMGFGYGAAIGAQMALGRDQRVVMFTGDGSFHMNLNEACTAVSYDLPIITVIFNNSVLGMVRQWQTTFYGKRYSQTDPHRHTDFVIQCLFPAVEQLLQPPFFGQFGVAQPLPQIDLGSVVAVIFPFPLIQRFVILQLISDADHSRERSLPNGGKIAQESEPVQVRQAAHVAPGHLVDPGRDHRGILLPIHQPARRFPILGRQLPAFDELRQFCHRFAVVAFRYTGKIFIEQRHGDVPPLHLAVIRVGQVVDDIQHIPEVGVHTVRRPVHRHHFRQIPAVHFAALAAARRWARLAAALATALLALSSMPRLAPASMMGVSAASRFVTTRSPLVAAAARFTPPRMRSKSVSGPNTSDSSDLILTSYSRSTFRNAAALSSSLAVSSRSACWRSPIS